MKQLREDEDGLFGPPGGCSSCIRIMFSLVQIGGSTDEAIRRISKAIVENISRIQAGKRPLNIVNYLLQYISFGIKDAKFNK